MPEDRLLNRLCEVPISSALLETFGRDHPTFYHAVRFELEKRLPLTKFTLYSCSVHNSVYWFGFKENSAITSEVYICSQGRFNAEDLKSGFELFCKATDLLSSERMYYLVADQCFTDALKPFLASVHWDYKEYPNYSYVMNKSQETLMESARIPDLPEGYMLVDEPSPGDAEVITATWKYSEKNELQQTKMKIMSLPFTCVKYKGNPIGFEMVDPNGTLNHLFVFEEHRGIGIGLAIHLHQIKKCIKEGFVVTKLVEPENRSVVTASDRSPFWTKQTNPDGSPLIRMYLAIWPRGTDFGG